MIPQISQIVAGLVKQLYGVDSAPKINRPAEEFGDFATNIGFELAPQLRKPPESIAAELAARFGGQPEVEQLTAAGGFINLRMSAEFWLSQLRAIGAGYGRSGIGQRRPVQVEFISANPTGPL